MDKHERAKSNSSTQAASDRHCSIGSVGYIDCAGMRTAVCGEALCSWRAPRTVSRNSNCRSSQRRQLCCSCQRLQTNEFFRSAGESGGTLPASARGAERSRTSADPSLARKRHWKFAGKPGRVGHPSDTIEIQRLSSVDHHPPHLKFHFKSIH